MKTGMIEVGGGFRGIYAAGVLDFCLDQQIAFDLGIGVSAGSANLASFAAGQKGRNYTFYTEYSFRKQYASLDNLIRKRSYFDMDYVYGTLSNHDGENPLNYPAIRDNPMDFLVVAIDAVTGQTRYFDKEDIAQTTMTSSRLPHPSHFSAHPMRSRAFPTMMARWVILCRWKRRLRWAVTGWS